MTWNQSLKTPAVAAFCAALATSVLAAPANRSPIATEQLGGTILSVTPQIPYKTAVLRISGPEGYALTKRFLPGTPVTADLLPDAEATEGLGASTIRINLPDGRYRYELILTTAAEDSQSHTGMFFVEGGGTVARHDKRAVLAAIRGELVADTSSQVSSDGSPGTETLYVEDWLGIVDSNHNGKTSIQIRSDGYTEWALNNDHGDLKALSGGYSGDLSMVLAADGRVGIGTTAPLQELHIHNAIEGGDLRLSGNNTDWTVGTFNGGNFVVEDRSPVSTFVLQLEKGAPANSLFVGSDGRVGIGTASPAADFDVQGHVRGTTFQSASTRELKTGFAAVDPNEILAKLSELPVTSWRYKDDSETATHLGPVAEDFQRLFGLGDGETISTVDVDGVALAAIQGLMRVADANESEVERLRTHNQELTDRVSALEATLAALVAERE